MALNVKVKRTIDSVFNEHRKGVSRILNEKHLVITVAGYHDKGDNEYDKFDGDAYRLAQIMIGGKYGGPKRPFMRVIHDIFKADADGRVKGLFKRNMRYDKHEKGWYVNWDAVGIGLTNMAHEHMTTGLVQSELPPLAPTTIYKRNAAGYSSPLALYATGQLAECIIARVK